MTILKTQHAVWPDNAGCSLALMVGLQIAWEVRVGTMLDGSLL